MRRATRLAGLLGCALLAGAAAHAEDPACADMAARRPPRPALPLTLDAHHQFRDAEFRMMDQGDKGYIDRNDVVTRMRCELGKVDEAAIPDLFVMICGYPTERCNAADFRRQGDAEFARVDADHDGQITAAELQAAGGSMHKPPPSASGGR